MKKESVSLLYQKYKLYIFPLVVVLSSLFLILFAIYPQTVKLISNQKAENELINKSLFLENKVAALESVDSEDLSRKAAFALAVLPTEKDFANSIGLLQQLTLEQGFAVNSISLGQAGADFKDAQSYELRLAIRGSKNSLAGLLGTLESSTRLMRINNVDISSGTASGDVDVNLVIEVLYSNLPKDFGSIDSPLPTFSDKEEELIASLARTGARIQPPVGFTSRGKVNPFE